MNKPALFTYFDGKIKPTGRVYGAPFAEERTVLPWPWVDFDHTPPPVPMQLHRFRFIDDAGPYSVYGEVA